MDNESKNPGIQKQIQEEFDKIIEKKNKEMMEQFQSRGKDSENAVIKIGG